MTVATLEGKVVSSPSGPGDTYVMQRSAAPGRSQATAGQQTGGQDARASGESGTGTRTSIFASRSPGQTPAGVPRVFGDERVIFYAWIGAMIIVSYDDWHNYHMLPRPARLWYTSLTFGLLAVVGMIPAVRPLATALAVGYTITLLWQYYNGTGQFK